MYHCFEHRTILYYQLWLLIIFGEHVKIKSKKDGVVIMDSIICPKCKKVLNDFEINRLWCTNCNTKFKTFPELSNKPKQVEQSVLNTITDKQKHLIISACQDCVKKHLKSPSTANFVNIDIKEQDKYGRIYLFVELDAQNSFGALLRNQLHVVLQEVHEDGTYDAMKDSVYKVGMFNTEDVVKKLNKWNKPK